MKKKLVFALLTVSIMTLAGCSLGSSNKETAQHSSSSDEDEDEEEESRVESDEKSTSNTDEVSDDESAMDMAGDENAEDTSKAVQISVQYMEESESYKNEDGGVLLTRQLKIPYFSISENAQAAGKINAYLSEWSEQFPVTDETISWAKEEYDFRLEDAQSGGYDFYFPAYEDDITMEVRRADENVISVVATNFSYSGGAHGFAAETGLNFSTQTGDLIAFEELSDRSEFRADTLSYNLNLSSTPPYTNLLFPSDTGTFAQDLSDVLYAEGKWYFSTTGITFISDPYALGPYSSGTIKFIIPYTILDEMGLKDSYQYHGNYTLETIYGNDISEGYEPQQYPATYTNDLNGDGAEDSAMFYTVYAADGSTKVHFIINGTDFSVTGDASLQENISRMESGKLIFYDMDVSDDTIEIALEAYIYNEEEDTYLPQSQLYRYDKDGSLAFLGSFEGTVTDPFFKSDDMTLR